MPWKEAERNPYLQGNFAPWLGEGRSDDLEVVGTIPPELNGTFYRNGPNSEFEPIGRYHWFDGDGMIHAVRLAAGRASYQNRWVESTGLLEERAQGRALFPGIFGMSADEMPTFKNTANTNIVSHAGRLLALMEGALPTRLDPATLATLGEYDFDGRLVPPMTAHPKMDPETGEMLFFGYSPFPPYLRYHVVDRAGTLLRSEEIDLAWPSMIHDFAITREHVVFVLCPLVFSLEEIARRGSPFFWDEDRPTRLGVMPRAGGNADVRWFDAEPSYVFHPMNAYAESGRIEIDAPLFRRLDFMDNPDRQRSGSGEREGARLSRWTIDLAAGTVRTEQRDDGATEFPRIDERRLGRRHRFGYAAAGRRDDDTTTAPLFSGIRRYDLESGAIETRWHGMGNGVGEPVFVPRSATAAEDDGFLLYFAYDRERDASDFLILDARNITREPVATVRLPHRVPYGFHGNWVAAA